MNIVKICPTCKETIVRSPLVDILVTYQEDLTGQEIYEQGWHRKCYPPAPALLAALEALTDFTVSRYASGGESLEVVIAARAAIAEARGEAG